MSREDNNPFHRIDFSVKTGKGKPEFLQMLGQLLPIELEKEIGNITFKWIITAQYNKKNPLLRIEFLNPIPIRWSTKFRLIRRDCKPITIGRDSLATSTIYVCQLEKHLGITGLEVSLTFTVHNDLMQQVTVASPSTHLAALADLLKTGKFSDAVIRLDTGTEMPVHKAILAAQSPYFARMLQKKHYTLESFGYPRERNAYDIAEVTDNTMRLVLQYMYTGHLDKIEKIYLVPLHAAANTFEMDTLKKMCHDMIKENLDFERAMEYLDLADYCEAEVMKNTMVEFLFKSTDRLSASVISEMLPDYYGD